MEFHTGVVGAGETSPSQTTGRLEEKLETKLSFSGKGEKRSGREGLKV